MLGDTRCIDPCAPEGERRTWIDGHPADRPEWRPRLVKTDGAYPWRILCDLSEDQCRGGGWKTKREGTAALASGPGATLRWLEFAAECAERMGLVFTAYRVEQPESACQRYHIDPMDPRERDWPACGQPITLPASALVLARFRLGWDHARQQEAVRPASVRSYAGDRDHDVWIAAWVQAREDMLAGRVTEAEHVVLDATPENAGYLRLDEGHRELLGRRLYQLERDALRRFYDPTSFAQTESCWASRTET